MKKIAVGCLIVLVIALIGFGVAGYYAFRWAQPMLQSTGDYVERARELSRLGDRVQNQNVYAAPANGELTAAQVDRFLAVQARVREELGARWGDIQRKADEIKAATSNQPDLTFTQFTGMFSDLAGIYMDGRRAQVNALNVQKFSDEEYAWVRARIYEAAGMEIVGGIDLSAIEQMARDGAGQASVTIPDLPKPNVPEANIALVKPHIGRVKESLPIAILGL